MARRFVRSVLDGVAPDLVDTAELLTGELMTNALIHARTKAEVRAWGVECRERNRHRFTWDGAQAGPGHG